MERYKAALRRMKLNILSDLHLSFGELPAPDNDADVVILAGDIGRPKAACAWAARLAKPVLYVPGNHEFYGTSIRGALAELRALCIGSNILLLDNTAVVISGVRFLGTTLWSDFQLDGDGARREAVIREALSSMRDFSRIRRDAAGDGPFSPADAAALFRAHSDWLRRKFAESHAGPTVVLTHHAPSMRSIHPRFAESLLNACFVSDADDLVEASRAQLWVHGHTHDSFDYVLHGTRVVCNPRGYARDGVNENPLFDPNFTVDIEPVAQPQSKGREPA